MKNVVLILLLAGGFFGTDLFGQSCIPGPACKPACCQTSCKIAPRSTSASVQLLPAMLEVVAPCTPEQQAACLLQGKTCKPEMSTCKGSQVASTAPAVPACTGAAATVDTKIDLSSLTACKPAKS